MQKVNSLTLNKHIGETIAKYRQDAGLTQNDVAEKLEIGYEAVSRMERGVVMPTVERLVELAEIFNCEAADLLTKSSNRTEDQAVQIHGMLSTLEENDRKLILQIVEMLSQRLN